MNHMFNDASAFTQDISSWKGTAANSAQVNMFDDATAFQAKYSCSDALHGPASSCVSSSGYEDRVSFLESVLGTSGKINPSFLTDATFHNAISECLKEAPIDGLCLNYGLSSGYCSLLLNLFQHFEKSYT